MGILAEQTQNNAASGKVLDPELRQKKLIDSPWLNPEEAAEYLRLFDKHENPNISYLYKMVSSGLLSPYKLGKFNRYRREDLDALLIRRAQ